VARVSSKAGFGAAAGAEGAALACFELAPGSVAGALAALALGAMLGAPPGCVAGDLVSPASATLGAGRFDPAGRMLGGGGRMLGGPGCALGGEGRMLGGGGRERPRTGGGGGVPEGRASGVGIPATGRGGSDTGRGGCAAGRGGSTDDGTVGVTAGATEGTGVPLAAPARFSLSLAVP
jgi:hypothetical protein